jgi:hypothetical protein
MNQNSVRYATSGSDRLHATPSLTAPLITPANQPIQRDRLQSIMILMQEQPANPIVTMAAERRQPSKSERSPRRAA